MNQHVMEKSFGSFEEFKNAFMTAGRAQFGSGWVWLVQQGGPAQPKERCIRKARL